jgi:DNA-binding NarL/FixJ family response regulator
LKDTLAMAVSAAGIDPSTAATPAGAKPSPVPETTPRPAVTVSVAAPAPTPLRAPPIQADSAEPPIPSRVSMVSPLRSRIGQITSSFKPTTSPGVDLMVLSTDPEFIQGLESALGMSYRLHTVQGVAQAIEVLGANAIGVFITDLAVHLDEVSDLTAQLKHHVPELVTIVASDHSDAHRLIDLINGGQVFRFLLKPIKPTQTAIWIESAVSKHLELVSNPSLIARHAVAKPTSSLITLGDRFLRSLASRVLRLRSKTSAESQESSRP